ncbi:TPA: FAD-dependent oxidoreductase, partial [Candidatus Scatousia excrementigallinarum]|nr:FAD-dependent oxidoreductase [Candidatus Scatousia excrementigallinarum]
LPECKKVLVQDLQSKSAYLASYDKLIIATGARPFLPKIKNIALNNVFTVRRIEDAIAIREKIATSRNVVIVGGGYIGIEMLEAFVRQGLHVTLIERDEHIMSIFDYDMADLIKEQLMSINNGQFEILTSETVTEFVGDNNGVNGVITGSGKRFEVDMAVICAGVTPNVDVAIDAGIQLGSTGAISVTPKMETNIPDIYACGDCVQEYNIVSKMPTWMPLGSNANKEGRAAAMNACGFPENFQGVLGSAVTRCLGLTMSITGLTEIEAVAAGFEPVSAKVTKYDKVGYMPDANNITLKLLADKKSGRLLGAQGVGAGDADKRINTLATALLAKLTVEEFVNNDLTYAPPFSPTIDPLLNAAQILMTKVGQES